MTALPSRRFLISAALGGAAAGALGGVPTAQAATLSRTSLATLEASTATTYNMRAYGAAGNAVSDDAPAINALIQTVAQAGGGVIEFPRGTYSIGSSIILQSGVYLVSAATNHGYIAAAHKASNVVFASAPSLTHGYVIDSPSDAIVSAGISGIDIQGGGAIGGIRLQHAAWCSIEKSHINGCGSHGILVGAGMACVFEDLLTTNCVTHRAHATYTGAFDLAGTDHYVGRCEFNTSLPGKSSSRKHVVAAAIRGANHFISDSVGEQSDIGWYVSAANSRFSNVRADTNWGDGWHVAGGSNAFSSCSSVGNSQSRSNHDDGWVVTGGGNSFAACNVIQAGSKQVRYGFNDTINNHDAATRNNYVGCVVDAAGTARWHTQGFLGSSPTMSPHAIRPAAGSTTVDVSQATLVVLFDYTAHTTIGHFSQGVNGQTIRVLGSAHVTIDHNGSIQTASGAPTRLRTGVAYTFTHYDGCWYQSV